MNPFDNEEIKELDKIMRADMPYHRQNELKVKFTYGNLPKNAMDYSTKVNDKFLNDNLGIIEEMEHRDPTNYIPKWFKAYQNGIYRDTEILNHDNFFKEKSGDSIENIDKYHFKHDGRIYAKVSGASPHIMNPSRFAGAVNGADIEFGDTSSLESTGTVLSFFTDDLQTCNPTDLYDQIAHQYRTGTTNVRLGCYDDTSDYPNDLLGETGSFTFTGYAFNSTTEFSMTTAAFWLVHVYQSAGAGGYSRASNGQMYYTPHTFGAMPDPAAGSMTNNGVRVGLIKVGHS